MNISQFKLLKKKLISKRAISLYLILGAIIFLNWGLINRFLYFEAAQIRDYLHKELLAVDSLSYNKTHIDTIYIV